MDRQTTFADPALDSSHLPSPTASRSAAPGRTSFRTTVAALAGLLLSSAIPAPASTQAAGQDGADGPQAVNRIVLRVNDQILTLHRYEERKSGEINAVLANPRLAPAERQERLAKVGQDIMQQIFREMLLESFASQNGVTASEAEIDGAIRGMMEQRGIGDTEQLREALASSGMTLDELRRSVRQELVLSGIVRREVMGKIEVGEDELRAFYRNNPEQFQMPEERWLQEVIVLEESGLGEEALLAEAEKLYQALVAGGDFELTVAEFQDQGLSTGVIDLGWLKTDEIDEALAEAAFAVGEGEYSEPVEARGGYHIAFTKEKKGGFVLPYDEVEDLILAQERQRRFGSELRKFMANLESTSYIREDLPPDAVGFRSLADDFLPDDELRDFRAPLSMSEEEMEELNDLDIVTPVTTDAIPPEVTEPAQVGSGG